MLCIIERAQSTSPNSAPTRKRAFDKALSFLRRNPVKAVVRPIRNTCFEAGEVPCPQRRGIASDEVKQ